MFVPAQGFSGLPESTDADYQAFSQARKNRTKLSGDKRLRVKIWRTRDHAPGATGQFLLLADKEYDISGRQFADTTADDDLNSEGGAECTNTARTSTSTSSKRSTNDIS